MPKILHAVEDAKQKWCPMAAPRSGHQKCVAHECMAWQWEVTGVPDPNLSDCDHPPFVESHDTHGFCGMVANRTSSTY